MQRPALRVRTREAADLGDLAVRLPRREGVAWIRDGSGLIGCGEVARYKASSFADAERWWADLVDAAEIESDLDDPPSGSGLVAFGSFVFDPDNTDSQSVLIVPEVIYGHRGGRSWITEISDPTRPALTPPLAGSAAPPAAEPDGVPESPRTVSYADGALSGPQWEGAVAEAVRRINAGGLDKVVLARNLLAVADRDLDPRWLVRQLSGTYRRCWTYLVDGLVGATPEMLVRSEAGLVTSRVLAGTIRRTGRDDHDLALAAALSGSSKDLEEHEYAVRSVAAALAPYCSGMNVPDAPYVLELPNVLHLATDVTAALDPGTTALGLAAALHPSAAVCGTPTDLARTTIAELEKMDRGRYAGPVGWIDARGDGEWGIALRCGQIDDTDPRQIRLYAGCGIVAGSDPEAELAESNAKLVPMRDALAG